jgi:ankyrin repeat protein
VVELLLRVGADVEVEDNYAGETSIVWAAKDKDGRTAVSRAAKKGYMNVVGFLRNRSHR